MDNQHQEPQGRKDDLKDAEGHKEADLKGGFEKSYPPTTTQKQKSSKKMLPPDQTFAHLSTTSVSPSIERCLALPRSIGWKPRTSAGGTAEVRWGAHGIPTYCDRYGLFISRLRRLAYLMIHDPFSSALPRRSWSMTVSSPCKGVPFPDTLHFPRTGFLSPPFPHLATLNRHSC